MVLVQILKRVGGALALLFVISMLAAGESYWKSTENIYRNQP
jgi:hypothetical protein